MDYTVRPLQSADLSQLSALRAQYYTGKRGKRPAGPSAQDTQSRHIQNNTLTLVCEQAGTLLGSLTATVQPAGLYESIWSIYEFCVPEQDAQDPVGSALLQEITHRAQKWGGHVEAIW